MRKYVTKGLARLSCFLVTTHLCFAQVQITSVEPTLTVCGPSGTVQISLQNTGGAALTGVGLQVGFPAGIVYQNGSASSLPAGLVEVGPGQFSLPDLPPGQTLQVSFQIQAGCGVLPLLQDPNASLALGYTITWNGGSHSTASNTLSILQPALQYAAITNQTYLAAGIGVTFTRTFTVTNAGNGALARFQHRETWGSCLRVVSVQGAQRISQAAGQHVLELNAAHFSAVGNGDGLLDPGESVSFSVTYEVTCCTNLNSTFQLQWGCSNQVCATVNASGGVSVPGGTPNLRVEWLWLQERSCYGVQAAAANRMRLRIRNLGTGIGRNAEVRITCTAMEGVAPASWSAQLVGTGPIPLTVISQSNPTSGCFVGTPLLREVRLRVGVDIPVGGEVHLEADIHTCPPNRCDFHTPFRDVGWEVTYASSCGQSYTTSGRSRSRQYNPTFVQVRAPACVPIGGVGVYSFQIERGPGIFILAPDGYAVAGTPSDPAAYQFLFTVDLPPCASLANQPVIWEGPDPTNPAVMLQWIASSPPGVNPIIFTEAARPPAWNSLSFKNSFLRIPIRNDACRLPGGGIPSCAVISGGPLPPKITVRGYYSPNATCEMGWCYFEEIGAPIMECPESVDCDLDATDGVPYEGILFSNFRFQRRSFGLPDNDQDGLPDGVGSLDFSKIALHAALTTDTVEALWEGVIEKPTGGSFPAAGASVRLELPGGRVDLEAIELEVRIRQASTGQVFATQISGPTLAALVSHTSNFNANPAEVLFELDLSPAALQTFLPGLPAGYAHGDSVRVWLRVRVERVYAVSAVREFVHASVAPCLYVAPQIGAPSSCGIHETSFQFFSHFFESFFSTSPMRSSGCGGALVEINSRFRPKGFTCGDNVFPYEYRNWSWPESLVVQVPAGWQYQAGSGSVRYGRTAGLQCANVTAPINPTVLPSGALYFDLQSLFSGHGGTWSKPDDEYTIRVSFRLFPTCNVSPNGDTLHYTFSHEGRLPQTLIRRGFAPNLVMNPSVSLQAQAVVNPIVADRSPLEWELEVRNTSNTVSVPYLFLVLTSGAGSVTVLQVEEIGGA